MGGSLGRQRRSRACLLHQPAPSPQHEDSSLLGGTGRRVQVSCVDTVGSRGGKGGTGFLVSKASFSDDTQQTPRLIG